MADKKQPVVYTKHARKRMEERGIPPPVKLKRVTKRMLKREPNLRNSIRFSKNTGSAYYDVENPEHIYIIALCKRRKVHIVITVFYQPKSRKSYSG